MAGNWPLIGRDDELREFAAALDRPDGSGLVLVGPAGVGKTRLATECLHLAAERGCSSTRVVASRAASTIPFGALAPLLPPGTTAIEQGLTALRQVTLALEHIADGRRLVLVVDDAHSLDDASAVLLQQLAARHAAFLVVTLRSGETPPDPVTSLWKDHGLERIAIEPLSRPRADHFVQTMLGDDVDQHALAAIWDKTEGNPMFLRELVMGALQDGTLVSTRGRWHLRGELAPSERLTELVANRLTGLSPREVEALEYVAFGEPLGLDLVGRICDAAAVEELERAGLVVAQRNGRRNELRLAHPMYGEVLRLRTPAVRTRSVCRSLAEALESTGAVRREDSLRVSLWRLDGGGIPPVSLLVDGAAQALFANEFAIADRLARLAFDQEPTFGSGMLLLEILYQTNDTVGADTLVPRVLQIAENDRQRAAVAVMQATSLFWKSADLEGSQRVTSEALATLEESVERDWVAAFHALVEVQAGRCRDAVERTEPLLADPNPHTFVRAALAASLGISIVGRCLDAVDLADRAFEARVELGNEFTLFQAGLLLVAKAVALAEAGRIDEGYEVASFTRLLAADANDVSSVGFCGVALARICLTAGRLTEAVQWADAAVSAFRTYGHPGPLRWALGYVALGSAWLGDHAGAAAALDELAALPPHPAAMLDVDILRARAWRMIAEGHLDDARLTLGDTAKAMRDSGQISHEASALHDLARLGDAREVADRLAQIAEVGQGDLYPAMAVAAAARARGTADALEDATERMLALGAKLDAAELAVATAEACRREGDQRRGAEWARRATELAAACGGARTPGLVQADAPVPLTQRERDVALLAAQGLTSKAIGERLFVASRTVDNHLARIYAKLGVNSRAELASALSVAQPAG